MASSFGYPVWAAALHSAQITSRWGSLGLASQTKNDQAFAKVSATSYYIFFLRQCSDTNFARLQQWGRDCLAASLCSPSGSRQGERLCARCPAKASPNDGSEVSIIMTRVEWDWERGQLEYVKGTERGGVWGKKSQAVTVNQGQWLR